MGLCKLAVEVEKSVLYSHDKLKLKASIDNTLGQKPATQYVVTLNRLIQSGRHSHCQVICTREMEAKCDQGSKEIVNVQMDLPKTCFLSELEEKNLPDLHMSNEYMKEGISPSVDGLKFKVTYDVKFEVRPFGLMVFVPVEVLLENSSREYGRQVVHIKEHPNWLPFRHP